MKPGTEKKIESAIQELNYTPNIFARGLRGGRTKSIGVVISEIANPFYSAIVDGIEEVSARAGYTILLACSSYDKIKLENELNKLMNYVDGIILCTNMADEAKIREIKKKHIPVVAIDIKIENSIVPSVEVDNYKAIYSAIEYLIKMGHENIYFLSEPLNLGSIVDDRQKGYVNCLREHNIKIDASKIVLDERLEIKKTAMGYEIMKNILKTIEPPAAVFGTSDLIIIGAMKAVLENNFSIPDDISFFGCDNVFLSEYTNPPLTTIKYNEKEMGKKGMELLISLISGESINNKRIIIDTTIIERNSVKKLNI